MKKNTVWLTSLFCLFLLAPAAGAAPASEQGYVNSMGMEFVLIPAGEFTMGTEPKKEGGTPDEAPMHKVSIDKPFFLGKYEVTQAQWEAVMGKNPSKFKGPSNPVEQVSWLAAQEFIKRLNAKEGHTRYRLPTEAEWEYAARAGTDSAYSFGNESKDLTHYAWYDGNSADSTHPVGQKAANPWGLFDMHGNVYEWAQDWYGEKYYADSPKEDPQGPAKGLHRVNRGGSWLNTPEDCRSGLRSYLLPDGTFDSIGLRLALSPE